METLAVAGNVEASVEHCILYCISTSKRSCSGNMCLAGCQSSKSGQGSLKVGGAHKCTRCVSKCLQRKGPERPFGLSSAPQGHIAIDCGANMRGGSHKTHRLRLNDCWLSVAAWAGGSGSNAITCDEHGACCDRCVKADAIRFRRCVRLCTREAQIASALCAGRAMAMEAASEVACTESSLEKARSTPHSSPRVIAVCEDSFSPSATLLLPQRQYSCAASRKCLGFTVSPWELAARNSRDGARLAQLPAQAIDLGPVALFYGHGLPQSSAAVTGQAQSELASEKGCACSKPCVPKYS